MFEFCAVQDLPSGEVRIVPPNPAITYCDPDQTTCPRIWEVPEVRAVQLLPLGEVRIVPLYPVTTYCDPDQVIPK